MFTPWPYDDGFDSIVVQREQRIQLLLRRQGTVE